MPVSVLDVLYRKMLLTKCFTKGWGHPDDLLRLFKFRKIISNRETCYKLVDKDYPIVFTNIIQWADWKIIEGKFRTPLSLHLPDIVSPEVQDAYFQMVLPDKDPPFQKPKPMCIHLAGTGDHYFWRRRHIMAKPLLKNGIASIILENPFYGLRKPSAQVNSSLLNVTDIFVMGGCLMLECLVLLHWCERNGYGPLGITGLSMGGHMASLAATCWPKPLVLVPCLSWSTASKVFTEGVMSDSINWDFLQDQFTNDKRYHKTLHEIKTIFEEESSRFSDSPNCSTSEITITHLPGHQLKAHMGDKSKWNLGQMLHEVSGKKKMKDRDWEAVNFMRRIMDECTHLKNFSIPYDTSLIIAVCAAADGYVPRDGCTKLEDIWPGAVIKYLDTGHVGAYLWYRKVFRESIVEAFEKAKRLHPSK